MKKVERIQVDESVISKLLALRADLGVTRKAVDHLNSKGANLTVSRFRTITETNRRNQRWFITQSDYRAITGKAPEYTVEDELEFARKMIRWYVYFTEGKTNSKLTTIALELGLGANSLVRFHRYGRVNAFKKASKDAYSRVKSYFLDWYDREGFRTREEVSSFLDEMEELGQEFPIFDRVPRELIDELANEISEVGGIPKSSLWPHGYSRKEPASRKTFSFSDYQRLLRIRDNQRGQLIIQLYQNLCQRINNTRLVISTILERYKDGKNLDPESIQKEYPNLGFPNLQSYAEWLYPILSKQNLSFRDYVAGRRSLYDITEWEEYLLDLEGWKINRVPEKTLIELRRK